MKKRGQHQFHQGWIFDTNELMGIIPDERFLFADNSNILRYPKTSTGNE